MQDEVNAFPITIVPDTNAIYGDPFLAGAQGRILLTITRSDNIWVAVPPVVRKELIRQYDDLVDKTQSEVEGALNRAARRGILDSAATLTSIRRDLQEARQRRSAVLLPLDVLPNSTALPWPKVDSEEITERDLARRRPFLETSSGSIGMRDSLIWQSVIEVCEQASWHHIIFVSNDKAFASEDGRLHDDLAEDIASTGLPDERFSLVSTLSDAVLLVERVRKQATARELAVRSAIYELVRSLDGQLLDRDQVGLPDVFEPLVTYSELVEIQSIDDGEPIRASVVVALELQGAMEAGTYFAEDKPDVELWGVEDDTFLTVHAERVVGIECEIDFRPAYPAASVETWEIVDSW